jgi:hypothetical protein
MVYPLNAVLSLATNALSGAASLLRYEQAAHWEELSHCYRAEGQPVWSGWSKFESPQRLAEWWDELRDSFVPQSLKRRAVDGGFASLQTGN